MFKYLLLITSIPLTVILGQVDFLDKVNEIDENNIKQQEETIQQPVKEIEETDPPESAVIKKTAVRKPVIPQPVWIDEFSPINDDYLKRQIIPQTIGSEKSQDSGSDEEKKTSDGTGKITGLNITGYLEGLAKYKKALIIILLLGIFAIYRIKGSRSARTGSPGTINKYRKR